MKECTHIDKVYGNAILCSLPPQRNWICRKCGERGTDTIVTLADYDEYGKIVKQFKDQKEEE